MFFGKADAEVSNAKSLLVVCVLKGLHLARSRFRKAMDRSQDVHRDALRNGADVSLGLFRENDPLQAAVSSSSR